MRTSDTLSIMLLVIVGVTTILKHVDNDSRDLKFWRCWTMMIFLAWAFAVVKESLN